MNISHAKFAKCAEAIWRLTPDAVLANGNECFHEGLILIVK